MRQLRALVFPVVLGLSDGICTALVLATQKMLHSGGLGWDESLRIALATCASGSLPLFAAQYAELRAGLSRAAHQLNMSSPQRLVAGTLGQGVLREAWEMAALATLSSFVGASIPLAVAVLFHVWHWLPLLAANIALAALGVTLGVLVRGSLLRWGVALMVVGNVLAGVGYGLRIA